MNTDTQQARSAILQTVDKLPSLAGKVATGGRLNVARAIGASSPQTSVEPDRTPPTPFSLLRPRNGSRLKHRKTRFVWQRSHDVVGIKYYKLYINGRPVKTVRGKNGKDPRPIARTRLGSGKRRWFVRAWDNAGNHRTSRSFRRGRYSKSSVLFVEKRRPKKVVARLAH